MAKKYIVDLNKDEKAELVSLTQKGRLGAGKIKDDKIETILTTLAQSQPPNGRVCWRLQLLARRLL